MDILYEGNDGLIISSNVLSPSEGNTPIGLCIAGTGFFGVNEKARWMSLKYIDYDSPETGTTEDSHNDARWGVLYNNDDVPDLNNFTVVSKNINITPTTSSYIYLINDENNVSNEDYTINLIDSHGNWNTSEIGEANQYAVTDINGKNNTVILRTFISQNNPAGYNTRNDPIYNCYRYHTSHTNMGDWYIGALGELAIMYAKMQTIENKLSAIHLLYPNDCFDMDQIKHLDDLITSTEYGRFMWALQHHYSRIVLDSKDFTGFTSCIPLLQY